MVSGIHGRKPVGTGPVGLRPGNSRNLGPWITWWLYSWLKFLCNNQDPLWLKIWERKFKIFITAKTRVIRPNPDLVWNELDRVSYRESPYLIIYQTKLMVRIFRYFVVDKSVKRGQILILSDLFSVKVWPTRLMILTI